MARDGEIQFRGTKGGLLVRFEEGEDFERLKERLAEKLDAAQKFFHGSSVTIDVGNRVLTTAELLQLEALFTSRYGVRVLQVVNGGEHPEADRVPAPGDARAAGGSGAAAGRLGAPAAGAAGVPRGAAALFEDPGVGGTLFLRKTVRSGQRVTYNGNVVVLGDVNPGAELIASGDVVVLGALRGLVHAGARGDEAAVVVAIRLSPTQLRIANVIGRAPDSGMTGPEAPEIARVRQGEIVIDPYVGGFRLEDLRLK